MCSAQSWIILITRNSHITDFFFVISIFSIEALKLLAIYNYITGDNLEAEFPIARTNKRL